MQGYKVFKEGEEYYLVSILYSSYDKIDVLNRLDLLKHRSRPVSSKHQRTHDTRHSYLNAAPLRNWQ